MAINAFEGTAESRGRMYLSSGKIGRIADGATPQQAHAAIPMVAAPISAQPEPGDSVAHPGTPSAGRLPRTGPLGGLSKRVLDLVVASSALLLSLPIILFLVLLIRLTSGGPALFGHRRIGFNGKSFTCYKFRTMVEDSAEALERHLRDNPEAAREWEATQKLRQDPRLIPFGRALRKSSLDELPQLINVLRGDMSCVGPRPVVAEELERYGLKASDYLKARPGLTGLWQVSGRSKIGYGDRVALDSSYVCNWSFWQDIVILMRTAVVLMKFDDAA